MSELEARFRVRLEGMDDFRDKLKKGERDAKEFQKAVAGAFKDSAKEIAGFAASTAKSLASLALGNVGIAAQAKNVLAFRDSVAQLTVTAGLGADKMAELRDQIHAVSKSSNQMQDDVTEALSAFVERTGDIDTARKNLELYGKVATATGASIKDVAYVGVELSQKLGIKDPAKQREALSILTAQGKMGAVEIRDLAIKAPAMFSAAAGMFDVEGISGLRGTGAIAQSFAQAFGGKATAGMTSTAVRQMFTDMTRRKEMIDWTLGKDTRGQNPYETVKQLIVATGGDAQALLKNHGEGIFTPTALAGVRIMAKKWRDKKKEMGGRFDPRTMGFEDFDRFYNASGDFGNIEKDFAIRRGTGQAAMTAAQISIAQSSDKNLGDAFDRLAHQSHKLSDAFDFATRHLGLTAGVAAFTMVGSKVGGSMLNAAIWQGVGGAAPGVGGGPATTAATAFATTAAPLFAALAGASIGIAIGSIIEHYTGGWLSTKGANALDYLSGSGKQRAEIANMKDSTGEVAMARRELLAIQVQRRGVANGEIIGRGAALSQADQYMDMLRMFEQINQTAKNEINVSINDDSVTVTDKNGTRSAASLVRRGAKVGEGSN